VGVQRACFSRGVSGHGYIGAEGPTVDTSLVGLRGWRYRQAGIRPECRVTRLEEGEEVMGILDRRVQLWVAEGAVEGINAAVESVLEEPMALQDEVLGGAEWGATRAE
jgi:hypothetical protein